MHYPNSSSHFRNPADGLLQHVEKAIDGEYSAISCYQQLVHLAPSKKEKNIIAEIRQDELKHFHTFSHIYTQLTGQKYTPKITESCPNNYKAGLNFAFLDEQHTVDFYLDTAAKAPTDYIKDAFTKAAMDEQNHAVWFLYFLK